ncbi:glucose-1-phosphate adenylyltransferase, partial [Bacillus vallismortis]|nr:glucose-1-phosphate adenylyltransferase [Bacillus vallismortis]
ADVTISFIVVGCEEASRLGFIKTYEDGTITHFDEKPQFPKSYLASMGIYIFNCPLLKQYLEMDDRNTYSSHDFGKD